MIFSKELHADLDFEVVAPEDYDYDGIPASDYYGQTIWDGEKFVTEEEWNLQQQEERRRMARAARKE
ncbi:hypothetical protein [uncultured Mitsuokella sp.]|uniref:hypothetical protein n=1 Tax=uncultured Mitsuokella sp. TaxID=453120 RepID=UPI00260CABE3|nr:hypothetical protein [uncultured Mitsuokella sp.]